MAKPRLIWRNVSLVSSVITLAAAETASAEVEAAPENDVLIAAKKAAGRSRVRTLAVSE